MNVTIGITHYNRPTLLEETLDMLGQLPPCFSICVVDDFSDEENYNLVKTILEKKLFRYTLYRHDKNLGPGAAKNSVFENCDSEYVFILDSDNGINAASLQYLYNYARANGSAIVAPACTRYFYSNFKMKQISYHRSPSLANLNTYLMGDEVYNNGNMLISKNVWKEVGGYPVHHTMDTQGFGLRLRKHGYSYDCVQGAVYYHRRHKNSRNSRFMQTSQSGRISLEQTVMLLEAFNLYPPFVQKYMAEYPIYRNSVWDNSLFTGIFQCLSAPVPLNDCGFDLIEEAWKFLNGDSNTFLDDYHSSNDKRDFYEFINELGEGFLIYSDEKKTRVFEEILKKC